MAASLDITGTQLSIRFDISNTATIRDVKETIKTLVGLPVARQTLRYGPAGALADDRTLASYNIGADQMVLMGLVVEPNDNVPITVALEGPQYPNWRATVQCMESTTLGQFKRLVANGLGWSHTGGMRLHHGPAMTSMEGDEQRPISEYLVLNGSVVFVQFLNCAGPPKDAMVGPNPAVSRF